MLKPSHEVADSAHEDVVTQVAGHCVVTTRDADQLSWLPGRILEIDEGQLTAKVHVQGRDPIESPLIALIERTGDPPPDEGPMADTLD